MGGIGVLLGAFGAHGLPSYLEGHGLGPERIESLIASYDTAVRYHLTHVLAMILTASLTSSGRPRFLYGAMGLFLLGILLFSGCIYAWVGGAGEWAVLVRLVPVGGAAFVAGWVCLAAGMWSYRDSGDSGGLRGLGEVVRTLV